VENSFLLVVAEDEAGKRLDMFLTYALNDETWDCRSVSRTAIQRVIAGGGVTVNGTPRDKNYTVNEKDCVFISLPETAGPQVIAEDIPLSVIYEDNDLIVLNKPKGMVVHPAPGHSNGTLVNALLYHCAESLSGIGGVKRPGIVHRLDKDTSGLLAVAKNDHSHLSLAYQFSQHSIEREYRAVCHGTFKNENGTIDAPIGRDPKDRKKFAVGARNSKTAVSEYSLLENYERFSHLSIKLKTGRTHQIRVHMASIGHPVAGDPVYAPKTTPKDTDGQCLHAKKLAFIHPVSGHWMYFDSELPDYFIRFLSKISGKGKL